MFAQASSTVPYPARRVAAALAEPSHPWAVSLEGDGRAHLAKMGLSIGRLRVYKHVHLHIDASAALLLTDSVMLPVSWKAVGGPPIFPRMEGVLHVAPAGPRATKLTLNASYDPPLGKLGQLIDRTLMFRVAQNTMADFVVRLGRALDSDLAADEARVAAP